MPAAMHLIDISHFTPVIKLFLVMGWNNTNKETHSPISWYVFPNRTDSRIPFYIPSKYNTAFLLIRRTKYVNQNKYDFSQVIYAKYDRA